LERRTTLGSGLGYQWIENPKRNFSTEAGLAWREEKYSTDETNSSISAELGYHFDSALNDN